MSSEKKWIWQQEKYPNFEYNFSELEKILEKIKFEQWVLSWIFKIMNIENQENIQLDIFTSDSLNTSIIEWEFLNRDSVRSSISNKLWIKNSKKDVSTKKTDWLTSILIDSFVNSDKKMDLERLFWWHNSLFESWYINLRKINVAKFRWDEEMQIVSWAIWHEKVYFIAPWRDLLEREMCDFLKYLNDDSNLSIIKAWIIHLWFVVIHPFDDWNWRIARALTDMILTRELWNSVKLYSFSKSINEWKKWYYEFLEKTSSWNLDITKWLKWFLETLLISIKDSQKNIEQIFKKTQFWDKNKNLVLNERQIKVLNKVLDIWNEDFSWWINTRKYSSITKSLKLTASRDIKDLVEKNILKKIDWTNWRNISYKINL